MKHVILASAIVAAVIPSQSSAWELTNAIIEFQANGAIVWSNVVPGHQYSVHATPQLSAPSWNPVVSNVYPVSMTVSSTVATAAGSMVFYQIADDGVKYTNINEALDMASVCGDEGTVVRSRQGIGDIFVRILVQECSPGVEDLLAAVQLQSPPQMNYDLRVYAADFELLASSSNGVGQADTINLSFTDYPIIDDSQEIYIHVVRRSGVMFSSWGLTIRGDTQLL